MKIYSNFKRMENGDHLSFIYILLDSYSLRNQDDYVIKRFTTMHQCTVINIFIYLGNLIFKHFYNLNKLSVFAFI